MGKHQPREFYKRPLTPEEAQFAADNLGIVYCFLNQRKLEVNEWFDVVIFRYMLAVKRYVSLPNFQQYSFSTIAYHAMSSAVSDEHRSRRKQIQTVSLFQPMPGSDDLTYADTITTENLIFVPYICDGGEDVKIAYNVELPDFENQRKSEEGIAIEKFLASDAENMCFEYDTAKEADLRAKSIRGHRNRLAKCHIYYEAHLRKNRIYITKVTKKEVAIS